MKGRWQQNVETAVYTTLQISLAVEYGGASKIAHQRPSPPGILTLTVPCHVVSGIDLWDQWNIAEIMECHFQDSSIKNIAASILATFSQITHSRGSQLPRQEAEMTRNRATYKQPYE